MDGAEERGKLIRVWQSSLKRLRFQSFDKRFTSLAATASVILCGPCLLLKRMTDVLHTSPLASNDVILNDHKKLGIPLRSLRLCGQKTRV